MQFDFFCDSQVRFIEQILRYIGLHIKNLIFNDLQKQKLLSLQPIYFLCLFNYVKIRVVKIKTQIICTIKIIKGSFFLNNARAYQ